MSHHNNIPSKQRAIVLAGGGALGAYQVGVLKVLTGKWIELESRNDGQELLFDIIAGTSIGAMNGAILVSQFLKTRNWEDAVSKLEKFWVDKKKGLGSMPSQEDLSGQGWTNWKKASKEKIVGIASEETARRYYSAKHFFWKGAYRVHNYTGIREDSTLFDNVWNQWFTHSSDPLEKTILRFADFPIATNFLGKNNKKQPRFITFSVDVAEGESVIFDSYPKLDGLRRSEYGKYTKKKGYENVINYNDGITMDQVMASGTLPEFYDYRTIAGHQFWDGGLLSNTPFRELLRAHQDYWTEVISQKRQENKRHRNDDAIPDLEVYIVNLHPSKQRCPPIDHDGVKDRQNDLVFGDRNSKHDEQITNLLADLKDCVVQMEYLSTEAISKVGNEADKSSLREKYKRILATYGISERLGSKLKYESILQGTFKLTKVFRIERKKYSNSIYGKIGDFSSRTIDELIIEGEKDTRAALKNRS